MAKQLLYQPPVARDLSGLAAHGAKPSGACITGRSVYNTQCSDGNTVQGTNPDTCSPFGAGVGSADCSGGGNGIVGCYTGSTNR
jgi:hypothetical protein